MEGFDSCPSEYWEYSDPRERNRPRKSRTSGGISDENDPTGVDEVETADEASGPGFDTLLKLDFRKPSPCPPFSNMEGSEGRLLVCSPPEIRLDTTVNEPSGGKSFDGGA